MNERPVLSLLLLRHGQTRYTQQFPDLTPEGLERTKSLASSHIIDWMRQKGARKEMRIFASPAPRAHGTAFVIKKEVLHFSDVVLEDDVRPMDLYDPPRCMELIRQLKGYIRWESEQTFNDTTLFEPRASVRARTLGNLGKQVVQAKNGEIPRFGIGVSHYETLCHIVTDLFGIVPTQETELRYLEPIELDFSENEDGVLLVTGRFREMTCKAAFDLTRAEFFF